MAKVNPQITRSYYDVIPGFNHDTPGVAQLDDLKAFAKAEGASWTDPRLQARYVLSRTQRTADEPR